jgi:hypothetical protein
MVTLVPLQDRTHFLSMAARVSRQALTDEARRRRAAKRDGGNPIRVVVLVWSFVNTEQRNRFLFLALSVVMVVLSAAATAGPSRDATPPSMSALKNEDMKIQAMPGFTEVGQGRKTVKSDLRVFGHGFRLKGHFAADPARRCALVTFYASATTHSRGR